MKKIKLTIASLLLAGFSYSQTQDTICHLFAGKMIIEFNYNNSKIINTIVKQEFENAEFELKKNQVIYIDLYDDCECNTYQDINKKRYIKLYKRNGNIVVLYKKSGNNTFKMNGESIEKIVISKQIN